MHAIICQDEVFIWSKIHILGLRSCQRNGDILRILTRSFVRSCPVRCNFLEMLGSPGRKFRILLSTNSSGEKNCLSSMTLTSPLSNEPSYELLRINFFQKVRGVGVSRSDSSLGVWSLCFWPAVFRSRFTARSQCSVVFHTGLLLNLSTLMPSASGAAHSNPESDLRREHAASRGNCVACGPSIYT